MKYYQAGFRPVPVDYPVDASKVVISGKGIEPKFCRANVPSEFKVDASKTGKAPMAVEVNTDKGSVLSVRDLILCSPPSLPLRSLATVPSRPEVKDNADGTYDVKYMPPQEGAPCQVKVLYDGKDVPKSPVNMKVRPTCEPQNVKVKPPANADKGIPASLPTEMVIDASDAGYGDLNVNILAGRLVRENSGCIFWRLPFPFQGPDKKPVPVRVLDNGDGTFKAQFTPADVGDYDVGVKYGGKPVPKTPVKIKAVPTGKALGRPYWWSTRKRNHPPTRGRGEESETQLLFLASTVQKAGASQRERRDKQRVVNGRMFSVSRLK
ncbi:unnamed protein product [Cyprideis torosa]|uniref:Uncharacterized protein n=1 Tax=Cyprideis torosa TaxID=163714 RepID=A0A7R8W8G7_9CRUS|nr:unnamed protein product [Cyprideis torosa]CAG0887475.1 unnamed protein product [Cyprideis torosa]